MSIDSVELKGLINNSFDKKLKNMLLFSYFPDSIKQENMMELLQEEPLLINIEGLTQSLLMRTPGEEPEHAAGFCFTEGIADKLDDIVNISLCDGNESNLVTVILSKERFYKIAHLFEKKSCSICVCDMVHELNAAIKPLRHSVKISYKHLIELVRKMEDIQYLRKRCSSSHAAMILDNKSNIISIAEDIGRHNALDKAVGKLFLKGNHISAAIAILSSRASCEMIQKCARVGIEIVVSVSRPTASACELSKNLGMTLANINRDNGLFVFSGSDRIKS